MARDGGHRRRRPALDPLRIDDTQPTRLPTAPELKPAERKALGARLAAGDTEVLPGLMASCSGTTARTFRKWGIVWDQWHDLYQEITCRVLLNARKYDPEKGDWSTWFGWQVKASLSIWVQGATAIRLPAKAHHDIRTGAKEDWTGAYSGLGPIDEIRQGERQARPVSTESQEITGLFDELDSMMRDLIYMRHHKGPEGKGMTLRDISRKTGIPVRETQRLLDGAYETLRRAYIRAPAESPEREEIAQAITDGVLPSGTRRLFQPEDIAAGIECWHEPE